MSQRDVVNNRGWKRAFEYPILLPSGLKLVTLLDAARSGLAQRNPRSRTSNRRVTPSANPPYGLADPTPSQSLEISAYITVYVGDKSCLLNSARLVSLF